MSATAMFHSPSPPAGKVWLGIDQSLTGFAVCVLDAQGNYEISVLHSSLRGAPRLKEIHEWLGGLIRKWQPEDVAMEGTVNLSASASVLGELAGVVKLCLCQRGCVPMVVPPMTLKKFVIGSAKNTAKSHMLLATFKRYGVELSDDNAVGAYGLARIVRGQSITVGEEEIIKKLAQSKFRE